MQTFRFLLVFGLAFGVAHTPALATEHSPAHKILQAKLQGATRPVAKSTATVATTDDLCAPCTDSSQCETGLCAIPTDPNDASGGYCSQACTQAGACPSNFACSNSNDGVQLCVANDDSVCPSPYLAPKNAICVYPSTDSNPNAVISRQCADGLTCFGFPADSSGNYVGVCVTECSSTNASASCAAEETCCFGTNADTSCQTTSTATVSVGGCFVIGDVGGSCAEPDHSFCAAGDLCEYTQVAAAATCYGGCSNQTCPSGGYCLALNGSPVCCDAATLNLNDVTTCQPLQGICRREVGVTCSVNADCRLGLCQKNGTQAACSSSCTTDADCPTASQDVNGDGVADGGSSCLSFGTVKRCWPLLAPAAAPACATAVTVKTPAIKQGCQCAGGGGADWLLLTPLALLLGRGAYKRRRRPSSEI